VVPHERAGNANQGVSRIADARRFNDLPAEPSAPSAIENQSDRDPDQDQDYERHDGGRENWHCKARIRDEGELRAVALLVRFVDRDRVRFRGRIWFGR
jgi:hypothetical protein